MLGRDMVQRTFKAKGLAYVSELALENVKAMKALVQWNHEHGIRFFRYSSIPLLALLKSPTRLITSDPPPLRSRCPITMPSGAMILMT